MKVFTNLPGNLRALFGFLRLATLLLAIFWLLTFTFNTWIQRRFVNQPKLMVTVGEITLPAAPDAVMLASTRAGPGALALGALRGTLHADLCSPDAALASALRWAVGPAMLVAAGFAWLVFGALRELCGRIEQGEVFSERNLRLVRRLGLALIVYTFAGWAAELWASHLLGAYFHQHVVLTGLRTNLPFGRGLLSLGLTLPPGFLAGQGGLVTGCLVLVVSEAFRQGLGLKTENDLTV